MILVYSNQKNIIIAFDHKIKKAVVHIKDMNDELIEILTLTDTDFKKINVAKNIRQVKLKIETENEIIRKKILLT